MPKSGSSKRAAAVKSPAGKQESADKPGSSQRVSVDKPRSNQRASAHDGPAGSGPVRSRDTRGRMHDAEATREAILDAGEEVFAEHGFDGARIDAIAEASGYNKSLIFQYFDDKLGLYSAVIRRADDETRKTQNEALLRLMGPGVTMDMDELRSLLGEYVGWYFDYLLERPQIMRIFNWEMAEGWQTFSKIMSERDFQDVEDFAPVFKQLQEAGMMREQPTPLLQFTTALFSVHTYLAVLPLYRVLIPETDVDSPEALAHARQFIIDFIINGLLLPPRKRKA